MKQYPLVFIFEDPPAPAVIEHINTQHHQFVTEVLHQNQNVAYIEILENQLKATHDHIESVRGDMTLDIVEDELSIMNFAPNSYIKPDDLTLYVLLQHDTPGIIETIIGSDLNDALVQDLDFIPDTMTLYTPSRIHYRVTYQY